MNDGAGRGGLGFGSERDSGCRVGCFRNRDFFLIGTTLETVALELRFSGDNSERKSTPLRAQHATAGVVGKLFRSVRC